MAPPQEPVSRAPLPLSESWCLSCRTMNLGHLQFISPSFHENPFYMPKNYSTLNT